MCYEPKHNELCVYFFEFTEVDCVRSANSHFKLMNVELLCVIEWPC